MTISIIAVSGSLRAKSTNTRLLQAVGDLVGSDIEFTLYGGIEELPQFNPDKEDTLNFHTEDWINQVRDADAIIVSSPEYAHGIPGAFKNALDWVVGVDAFIEKPFCLYRACPRPEFAPEALLEVLRTMSGIHVVKSDVTIDLHRHYDTSSIELAEEGNQIKIINSIKFLCDYIENREKPNALNISRQ